MGRKRNDSIEFLTDALAGALAVGNSRAARAGRDPRRKKAGSETKAVRFARGLALGALVGAALTGLIRYRGGRLKDASRSESATDS